MTTNKIKLLVMNKESSLYYEMDNCKHKPVTVDNGEIVCCLCGIVLGQDYYYNDEDNNIFYDKRSKTDPWLLGLGSKIGVKDEEISKIVKTKYLRDPYLKEESNFANLIEYLNLHNHVLEVRRIYKKYNKRKGDKSMALKLAVMSLTPLDEERVDNALWITYRYKPNQVARGVKILTKWAGLLGARSAYSLYNRVMKDVRN